ncbi:hypothetical protein P43SY_002032 [Pythium insidiosum]|uniref:Uncharacterized protein n=1 Tax=Pythium insidiosum TaxID=114742 RepID=A0AAD5M619_PYTIN|nr:hypothetical protein P43SY_002032 [Pythium insidiosum]
MSVNAAFSIAFNPNAQLFRNLRDATSTPVRRPDSESEDNASSSDGSVTLRDIDDELVDQVRELTTANEALERETQETYELLDQMQWHIESLEEHQHALVAYVNKLCNDVKTVKRRGVWQKIEYDKERQQLVEELFSWKRQAEELKSREQDALAAAEANAAWEAACLNQTIEQLQGEVLALKTELETAQEELSRRASVAKASEESEQMLEALKELVIELKGQVDDLEQHKAKSNDEIRQLRDLLENQELAIDSASYSTDATSPSDEKERISSSSTDTMESEVTTEDPSTQEHPLEPPLGVSVKAIVSNQENEDDVDNEEKALTPESPVCGQPGNQEDEKEMAITPPVSSKSAMSSLMDEETDDERDSLCESPLVTPRHSDSFFDRLSFFSGTFSKAPV